MRELLDYLAGLETKRPELLTGWREEFVGRRLVALLEGRSEVHVSGWPANPQIEFVSHPVAKKRPHATA